MLSENLISDFWLNIRSTGRTWRANWRIIYTVPWGAPEERVYLVIFREVPRVRQASIDIMSVVVSFMRSWKCAGERQGGDEEEKGGEHGGRE
jgi:hypothetical protein